MKFDGKNCTVFNTENLMLPYNPEDQRAKNRKAKKEKNLTMYRVCVILIIIIIEMFFADICSIT